MDSPSTYDIIGRQQKEREKRHNRRPPPRTGKKPPPRMEDMERYNKQGELIRMIIRGKSNIEASEFLGVNVNTISNWKKDPEFQLRLTRTRKAVYDKTEAIVEEKAAEAIEKIESKIKRVSYAALDVVASKMSSENENVALRAAVDLLDRNPETSKTKKIQAQHMHAIITADALVTLAEAAKQILEDRQYGGRPHEPVDLSTILEGSDAETVLIEGM